MNNDSLMVPVSVGELADKITILQIKSEMIKDTAKKANVDKELGELLAVFEGYMTNPEMADLVEKMKAVNLEIWHLSDIIHDCQKSGKELSPEEVHSFRVIHNKNDERFALKKAINNLSGSVLKEEKSYEGA